MKVINNFPCVKIVGFCLLVMAVWLFMKYMGMEEPSMELPDGMVRHVIPAVPRERVGLKRTGHSIQVEVFYESLCPDSRNYIVDQLAPAVARLPPDALSVTLVPYGKAETHHEGSRVRFTCQHQEEECWGNKLHACGIRQAVNQTVTLQFVTCLMKQYRRLRQKAQECAEASRLAWAQLSACADGSAIDADMVHYGEMTEALKPPAHFIPTITVGGSQDGQAQMFGDFLRFVCKAYQARWGKRPIGCP